MSSRPRWIGGVALLLGAAGLLVATRLTPVEAGPPTALPRLVACRVAPAVGPGSPPQPGTSFKLQAVTDGTGALIGQHLVVGAAGQARAAGDLPAESSASGPVGGVVVVAADDGRQSSIQLVAAAAGCQAGIYTTDAVVRRAILDPADGSVLFHLVRRDTRADLGTWRLGPGATQPTRVLEPLPATLGLGQVWATDLRLDADGERLAVQSCQERGCLTRIVDLAKPSLPPMVIRGATEGPLLGFAGDRLVTWAACDGYPCAVVAWDVASAGPTVLVAEARAAALTGDGRVLLAIGVAGPSEQALAVDLAGGATTVVRGVARGDRPIAVGGLAAMGLEVAPDQVALAPQSGDPHAFRPVVAPEVLP